MPDKMEIINSTDFKGSAIPTEIINLFTDFLQTTNTTTEQTFAVNDLTNEKILMKEKVTTKQQDLKATLSFFERVFPQYFDPIAKEKLEQLRASSVDNGIDSIKATAREIFTDEG